MVASGVCLMFDSSGQWLQTWRSGHHKVSQDKSDKSQDIVSTFLWYLPFFFYCGRLDSFTPSGVKRFQWHQLKPALGWAARDMPFFDNGGNSLAELSREQLWPLKPCWHSMIVFPLHSMAWYNKLLEVCSFAEKPVTCSSSFNGSLCLFLLVRFIREWHCKQRYLYLVISTFISYSSFTI